MSNLLQGKVAIIAGGGGHVGLAVSRRLAAQGATIVILARRNLEKVEQEILSLPYFGDKPSHLAIHCCVKDSKSIEAAAQLVKDKFGRCDILVNSAAVSSSLKSKDLSAVTDDIFDHIMQTNVRGTFAVVRSFQSLLLATHSSVIINLASASGVSPNFRNMVYSASKAAVISLTQSLAVALAPNVRVVSISPGPLTNPVSGVDRPPQFNAEQAQKCFLQRLATPDDVAAVIEACVTQMIFINGQNIVVDGGRF